MDSSSPPHCLLLIAYCLVPSKRIQDRRLRCRFLQSTGTRSGHWHGRRTSGVAGLLIARPLHIVGHWRHVPLHPISPPLKRIHTDKWVFSRNGRARRLAYRECAALQGFPRSFVWKRGSVRDRFQMIGNAVPPPLFEAVVKKLNDLW